MDSTRFWFLIVIFFVQVAQGMLFDDQSSIQWQNIINRALSYARTERPLVSPSMSKKGYSNLCYKRLKRVYTVKNISDILPVICDQARIGLSLARQKENEAAYQDLSNVLTKAQHGITIRDMRYCLQTLEQFFTGNTIRFKEFHATRTLHSARLLLADNYKALDNN